MVHTEARNACVTRKSLASEERDPAARGQTCQGCEGPQELPIGEGSEVSPSWNLLDDAIPVDTNTTHPSGASTSPVNTLTDPPEGASTSPPTPSQTLPRAASTSPPTPSQTLPRAASTSPVNALTDPPEGASTSPVNALTDPPEGASTSPVNTLTDPPEGASTSPTGDPHAGGSRKWPGAGPGAAAAPASSTLRAPGAPLPARPPPALPLPAVEGGARLRTGALAAPRALPGGGNVRRRGAAHPPARRRRRTPRAPGAPGRRPQGRRLTNQNCVVLVLRVPGLAPTSRSREDTLVPKVCAARLRVGRAAAGVSDAQRGGERRVTVARRRPASGSRATPHVLPTLRTGEESGRPRRAPALGAVLPRRAAGGVRVQESLGNRADVGHGVSAREGTGAGRAAAVVIAEDELRDAAAVPRGAPRRERRFLGSAGACGRSPPGPRVGCPAPPDFYRRTPPNRTLPPTHGAEESSGYPVCQGDMLPVVRLRGQVPGYQAPGVPLERARGGDSAPEGTGGARGRPGSSPQDARGGARSHRLGAPWPALPSAARSQAGRVGAALPGPSAEAEVETLPGAVLGAGRAPVATARWAALPGRSLARGRPLDSSKLGRAGARREAGRHGGQRPSARGARSATGALGEAGGTASGPRSPAGPRALPVGRERPEPPLSLATPPDGPRTRGSCGRWGSRVRRLERASDGHAWLRRWKRGARGGARTRAGGARGSPSSASSPG
ncbi:collagen alpha-1(I) chain-like [Ochotona curzoniae]|uniref:collagen alpha-1(I) chain-like n=1 Tax=Ochotona curzoniae TaxID=130825 RepID=UPI001B3491B4|nr:collagen alpha-1(I) chain-like [Ochotona curzoniae]